MTVKLPTDARVGGSRHHVVGQYDLYDARRAYGSRDTFGQYSKAIIKSDTWTASGHIKKCTPYVARRLYYQTERWVKDAVKSGNITPKQYSQTMNKLYEMARRGNISMARFYSLKNRLSQRVIYLSLKKYGPVVRKQLWRANYLIIATREGDRHNSTEASTIFYNAGGARKYIAKTRPLFNTTHATLKDQLSYLTLIAKDLQPRYGYITTRTKNVLAKAIEDNSNAIDKFKLCVDFAFKNRYPMRALTRNVFAQNPRDESVVAKYIPRRYKGPVTSGKVIRTFARRHR